MTNRDINLDFLKAYNELDNLLKQIYGEREKGVTSYIDDMYNKTSYETERVYGFYDDLKVLKNLRHKRNDMVHNSKHDEPVFTQIETQWIMGFKDRVMKQSDPLSQVRKNIRQAPVSSYHFTKTQTKQNSLLKSLGIAVVCVLFVVLFIMIIASAVSN